MTAGRSRARWLVLVAALAGAALTARLGMWQFDRAQQKLARAETIRSRADLPPITPAELDLAPQSADSPAESATTADPRLQPWLERRIKLYGQWLDALSIYLDNRQMAGRPGFYLLTPLRLADGRVIMVQRGWWPRDPQDRSRVPARPAGPATVSLTGRITAAPARTFSLGGGEEHGAIRQNLDVVQYGRSVGLAIEPMLVLQLDAELGVQADAAVSPRSAPPATGDPVDVAATTPARQLAPALLRSWPLPTADVDKHYGYATQWFALSALILILYVWFQIIRPRLRRS
jgi:surfeit locus 1 family protein